MPDFRLPAAYYERPQPYKYNRGVQAGYWYNHATTRMEMSRFRTPEEYGAVGNGVTNDYVALQNWRDALQPGEVGFCAPGKTYRFHRTDDHFYWNNKDDITILGRNSTILSTYPDHSGMQFENSDNVWIEGLTLATDLSSVPLPHLGGARGSTYHHQRITALNCANFTAIDLRVMGSFAGGIFIAGTTSNFQLIRPIVRGTRADGIHLTGGCNNGWVSHPQVHHAGDDGIATISYYGDPDPCHHITVDNAFVGGQYHGRGMTVVGGNDIEYRNFRIHSSRAAAIYIGVEGNSEYSSHSVQRVKYTGGHIIGSPQAGHVEGHPAVLIFNDDAGTKIVNDVELSYTVIEDTGTYKPCNMYSVRPNSLTNVKLFGNQILGQFSAGTIDGWINKDANTPTPTVVGEGASQGVNNIPANRVRAY